MSAPSPYLWVALMAINGLAALVQLLAGNYAAACLALSAVFASLGAFSAARSADMWRDVALRRSP